MELFIRVDQSQSVVGHGAEHWVFADLDGLFESGERFVVKTLSHVGEPKIMAGLGGVRVGFKRPLVTRGRLIEVARLHRTIFPFPLYGRPTDFMWRARAP